MFQRKVHRSPAVMTVKKRPPWRLLVESPDGAVAISNFDAFHDAGFEITVCGGPMRDAAECPVVRGEPCPLMAGADVVLFDLDPDRMRRSQVLAAMRRSRPDLPIVVRSTAPAPETASGCTTIRAATSVGGQVSALRRAVMR